MRCQGERRYGGAFTLGRPEWKKCHRKGVVMLTVKQEGGTTKALPACRECWKECIDTGVEILKAEPC